MSTTGYGDLTDVFDLVHRACGKRVMESRSEEHPTNVEPDMWVERLRSTPQVPVPELNSQNPVSDATTRQSVQRGLQRGANERPWAHTWVAVRGELCAQFQPDF